jgi:hypothetical protein
MGCPGCGRLLSWAPLKSVGGVIPASATVCCTGTVETTSKEGQTIRTPCTGKVPLKLSGIHQVTKRGVNATGEWFGKYVGHVKAKKPLWWSYKDGVLSGDVGHGN